MAAPSYVYDLLASESLARWGGDQPVGTPVTITYSFAQSLPPGVSYPNFTPFTATEIAAAKAALAYISALTKITFIETASAGELQFGNGDLSGASGRATYSYNSAGIQQGTVFLANTGPASLANSDFEPGSITSNDIGGHGWSTLLHELGHALGLKHPFETNIAGDAESVLPAEDDDLAHTIMSYTPYQPSNVAVVTGTPSNYSYAASNLSPDTYSLYDIAALQYLYGANTSSAGGKVFSFSPDDATYQTIYDSGPNNTIDCSALTGACRIDLTPGAFSDLAIEQALPFEIGLPDAYDGSSALAIAYGARIANCLGGSGNDDITGNTLANSINGGAGADTMRGGTGNDTYFVDNAGDRVVEAAGRGTDVVAVRVDYALAAGVSVETLRTTNVSGTAGLDLSGNEFAQKLQGNAGANTLDGRGGADTMTGYGGNDVYFVDATADTVVEAGGGGADTVAARINYTLGAGVAVETLRTASNAGTTAINLAGNELSQAIAGNAGANVLYGRGGNDVLTGLGGADAFVFDRALGASNVDRITDFAHNVDRIRLDQDVFTVLPVGALASSAFKDITSASADASDRVLYDRSNGALFYDRDGSGAQAAVRFATLANEPAVITAADFLIVA